MEKRRRKSKGTRRGGPWAAEARRRQRAWIIVGSVAAGLMVVSVLATARQAGAAHPEPRAEEHRSHVVSPGRYAQYPRVARTYQMAAAVPEVLDGLYCYCHCSDHSGHYSLLDCFASDHAARCDVCMSEATIAYEMHNNGASLKKIRTEIDRTYGT